MKIIQKMMLSLITAVTAGLATTALPVNGAVVVNSITANDWNSLISTHEAAWSVMYRGGSTSSNDDFGVEEIRLARNIATPQANGGLDTLTGNLIWSTSNNGLEILIDTAGNISARANAVTVGTLAVTRSYNQILIRVFDESILGSSDLQDMKINGDVVRNMFADGFGSPGESDIVSIQNFGSQAPFSWNGVWSPGSMPADNDQYVWIVALQNDSIPEPSSILLVGITSVFLLRRKRE